MISTGYRIFALAVETQSLAKTADILHMSPSAVSHSLSKLEQTLGLRLVIRGKDGIRPTTQGEALLPHVRRAMNADESLAEEVGRICGTQKGSLRIGAFSSVGCSWIPDIVARMQQSYPLIELRIRQGGYDDLEELLDMGELDVIFASIPLEKTLPAYPLLRDRLLCITPRGFHAKDPERITIDEIRDQTFILPCEGMDFDATNFLNANHLTVRNPHRVAEDAMIVAMVESGMGISIMPELVLQKLQANVNVYPIESAPVRTIGLATQRPEFVTQSVRIFLKVVQKYIAERYRSDLP